jgi:hypothetical protein
MSKAFKVSVASILCGPIALLGACVLVAGNPSGKTAGAWLLLIGGIPLALVIWWASRKRGYVTTTDPVQPGTSVKPEAGLHPARTFQLRPAQWIEGFGSLVVLAVIGNYLGWFNGLKSLPAFDTSPIIHVKTEQDWLAIAQLRTSLPENTYTRFDSAFQSVLQFCAYAEQAAYAASGGGKINDKCINKNLDGKSVNQVINLGSRLDDSSLSINDRIQFVN